MENIRFFKERKEKMMDWVFASIEESKLGLCWKTQFETLTQVGRDEVKARMKELESELARAEQTSALREEVFCLFPCFNFIS